MRLLWAVLFFASILAPACFVPAAQADEVLTLALDEPELETSAAAPKADTLNKAPAPSRASEITIGRVGVVKIAKAGIYRSKSGTSTRYYTAKSDTPLTVVRQEGDWYGVLMSNGEIGWISRDAVKLTEYEVVADKHSVSRGTGVSRGGVLDRAGTQGSAVVQTAMSYSGCPYVYGGTDPATGIDCSAFVRLVFARHGINLPRTAREQAQVGAAVPLDRLEPGDRLYFCCKNAYIDHCGIYAGNGYFIHSSASRGGVAFDSLASAFYWRSLVVARR